ncbi:MAG TPA: Calx-beta domain-containing protein [Fibrobacteria bacterium]|nr:Calx-beta domain-containing protein [Fibrobacteria bacterium]
MSIHPIHRPVDRGEQVTSIVKTLAVRTISVAVVLLGFGAGQGLAGNYYSTSGIQTKQFTPNTQLNQYWLFMDSTITASSGSFSTANFGYVGAGSWLQMGNSADSFRTPIRIRGSVLGTGARGYFFDTLLANSTLDVDQGSISAKGIVQVAGSMWTGNPFADSAKTWIGGNDTINQNGTFTNTLSVKGSETFAGLPVNNIGTLNLAGNTGTLAGGGFGTGGGPINYNQAINLPVTFPTLFDSTQLPGYNIAGLDDATVAALGTRTAVVGASYATTTCGGTVVCTAVPAHTVNGVNLPAGQMLPPGYYGALSTANDVVYLGEGVYYFDQVNLGNSGTMLIALQPNGGRTIIFARNGFSSNSGGIFIGPDAAVGAIGYGVGTGYFLGGTLMIVGGSHSTIHLDSDTKIWATLSTPTGRIEVNSQVTLFGQMFGRHFNGANSSNNFSGGLGAFVPFDPSVPVIKINKGSDITTKEGPGLSGCTMPAGTFPSLATPACRDTTIYVTISAANAYPVSFSYNLVDGTAVNAANWNSTSPTPPAYSASPTGTLTIPAGSTQVALTFKIIDNTIYQGSVGFKIALFNPQFAMFDTTGGGDSLTDTVKVTILDNEVGALAVFAKDTGIVAKTGGSKSIRINLQDAGTGLLTSIGLPDTIWFDTLIRGPFPAIEPTHYGIPGFHTGSPAAYVIVPVDSTGVNLPASIVNDGLYGPDRTFRLKLRKVSSGFVGKQDSTTILIQNTIPAPTINVYDTSAVEGAIEYFRVALSGPSALPACFHWGTAGVTAKAGQDYNGVTSNSVCIPAGTTTTYLQVQTLTDDVNEPSETFNVNLHPDSGITRAGSDTNAVGTIINTTPMPGVTINDVSIVRSATVTDTMKFTVDLIDTAGKVVHTAVPGVFSWSIVPLNAIPGTDYVVASGTLTFNINTDSTKTISIAVPPDSRYYANPKQFDVVLTGFTAINGKAPHADTVGLGSVYSAVGKPVLHIDDTSALEGNAGSNNPMTFLVRLLDSTGAAVTSRDTIPFTWSTADSSAQAGKDYVAVPTTSTAILPGQTTTTLVVSLIGNNTYQNNRALKISLQPTTGKPDERVNAVGTIIDDDSPPRVVINDQTGFRPQTTDSAWVFTISLRDPANPANSIASGKPVTVRVRTFDSSATVALGDYLALQPPLVVTFNPGQTTKTVSVTVRHDLHFAPTLYFKVALDSLSGATFQDSLGVGTILNSNPKPVVQVQGGVWDEGDTAQVSVLLVDPRSNTPTWSRVSTAFTWIANDSTAIHDSDYVPVSRSPDTIRALSTGDTLLYRLVVHQIQLPRRDFRVTVTADTAAVEVATTSQPNGFVGILNHALPPKIWVDSSRNLEPRPGDTTTFAHFRISLTEPSGLSYTVVVQTSDGSAIQDVNYRGQKDTIVFAPKQTTKDVYVRLLNDATFDTTKSYFLTVISSGNLIDTLGARGLGTIVNTDTLLAGVKPAQQNVGKDTLDTMYAYIHVGLSIPSNQSVSVKYATQDSSVQTQGLYVPISGVIVFRPGQVDSLLRVAVPPSNLKLTQANFFKLVLDSAEVLLSGKDSLVGYFQKQAVVRLFDATNASRLTIDSVVTPKRDTVVWFKLHLSRPIVTDQTIQFQTIGGTALPGRDFVDTTGSHVLKAGQILDSIPVHILADDVYFQNPRIFTLSLSYLDTFIVIPNPNGIGKIVDQTSPPAVTISDAAPVRETQTAWFPLQLTVGDADTIRVVWHTVAGSAKPGTNYVDHPSDTLVILPKQKSLQIPILTMDDGVYDTTLHFQVRIDTVLGGGAQVGSPRIGIGAIFDGGALPAVKFVPPDTTVREDLSPDSLWLSVVLTRSMGYSVTIPVRLDTLASTAKVPANFGLPTASVTFPAGRDTVRLLVLIHHDSINTDNLKAVLKLEPNPRDSVLPDPDSTEVVTILNVDPPPYIAFRDSLLRVSEADTTVRVPLVLSKISGKTISGTLVVSGGNARVGIDYDLPSGAFTLVPGSDTTSVAIQLHDDHRYGPTRDLWVHFTPMDTSKVRLDPLTARQSGDDRDTVFHLEILNSTPRPDLTFSPNVDTAKDIDLAANLGVVLSGLSDSVSKAGVVFLDSSKPELRKLHLTLATDTAIVDSGRLSTTVRVTWTNDGKVYDTARTVHLVLRGSSGAGIGGDSIVTLILLNTNKPPVVVIKTPLDSSRTSNPNAVVDWTVNGVSQPTSDITLQNGWNTITKCFTDTAGNTGCDTHHVWADLTPPAVQVFKITGPNTHTPSLDTTWWGKIARTRFGVDTVWYWVRDSIENSNGTWRVVVDTLSKATNFHGDSLFAVPVSACDSLGNCGEDTGWISLKQSIPVVDILTPPNGAQVVQGQVPVVYTVADAGKTWTDNTSVQAKLPGPLTVTECYTDDVGNTGCDSHTIHVLPIQVVGSVYVDLNGDGMVDAAIVTLDSKWTSSTLPSFDFQLNDSTRTGQQPKASAPFYSGPSRGTKEIVAGDTFWVAPGDYVRDSLGNILKGPDGKPLTDILGDTAFGADGSILRDSLGRILYKVAGPGQVDSTRFLVPIVPPFAFGQTGFDSLQAATMVQTTTSKDSTGKVVVDTFKDAFKVGDQVPPVILSAIIHRVENYTDPDTLFITPSEKIDLSSGKDWLQVFRCTGGLTSCDTADMAWVDVPADSVHKNSDGTYWFLVPPGDSGSINPNYKVRFSNGVSDVVGNGADTLHESWATPVTGPPRPPLVQVTPPNGVFLLPSSEQNRNTPGVILLKATRGKGDGTSATAQWWAPGSGYAVDMSQVRQACPQDNLCDGPVLYINRPARLILYIYDLLGTFVTSSEVAITQADFDSMQPDQLDRVSIDFEWNFRTRNGQLVSSGVYLWRIVSFVQVPGKSIPAMENKLVKVGVKVK